MISIFILSAFDLFGQIAVTENEPSALVENCVSAITGDLFLAEEDALVQGYIPLRIPRFYISGDGKGKLACWSSLNHLTAIYKGGEHEHKITIQEPNGSTFTFHAPADEVYNHFYKKKHPPKFRIPSSNAIQGLTNTSQGEISAHTNLKNASVRLEGEGKYLTVHCSDCTTRRYKIHHHRKHFKAVFKGEESKKIKYLLESETLPSGHKVVYHHDHNDRLDEIHTKNPSESKTYASAYFHYHHVHPEKIPDVDISLSDGRTISYRYEGKHNDEVFLLKTIRSPEAPEESIFYHPHHGHCGNMVRRVSLPDLRYFDIDYYHPGHNDVAGKDIKIKDRKDPRSLRVKTLKAPVGHDATPHVTHRFFYGDQHTDVHEIDNVLVRYHYSPSKLLQAIERFNPSGGLYNKETFEWLGAGDLLSRSFYDSNHQIVFSRRFHYDPRGNVFREELSGNLSGQPNAWETYWITRDYSQDGRDLLLKEEEQNGKITRYDYLPDSDLVSGKYLCEGAQIKVRIFYEYNPDRVLIREIHDDGAAWDKNDLSGVKTRTIKSITPMPGGPFVDMPQIIEEKYWDGSQERLLKKTVLTYTKGAKIEQQDVYDASGTFNYRIKTVYDELGRPREETNPIGQTAKYTYDAAGNKQTSQTASGRRVTLMSYDFCNRLIESKDTGFDGIEHVVQHTYDGKHNKTAAIDHFGNITRYNPDNFGNIIETQLPNVQDENCQSVFPVIRSTYDGAGREITRTDPKGFTTRTHYNARGQKTFVQTPDGAAEHFYYNLDGTLKTHIDPEGDVTSYIYDAFGRCISATDPLGYVTRNTYHGSHLIASQDPEGNITTYTYDGAGRKISEEKNRERKEFSYDHLNRLHSVKAGALITFTEYDLLDRLIEERQEDDQGQILSKTIFEYDEASNKKTIIRSIQGEEAKEQFEYDSFDRLILQIDALGNETRISYDEKQRNALGQRILQKTTIDPLEQKTMETYDSHGRMTRIEIQNAHDKVLSLEEKYYDLNGNFSTQISTVYPQNRQIITRYQYDQRNFLSCLQEPMGKTTYYKYTPKGLLEETRKPDNVILKRHYDPNGNLISLESSDRSIIYLFGYNKNNQLISSTDCIKNAITLRRLDPQGRVLEEKFANQLIVKKDYDSQGRCVKLVFPDNTSAAYDYDALNLKSVSRRDSSGFTLYTHLYQEYDLSGNLISEQFIGNLGEAAFTTNPLGKKSSISSPFFSQSILKFDLVGNIIELKTQSQTSVYSYDDLYQLIEETGTFTHHYAYDSHHNRLQKNEEQYCLNSLNQFEHFSYDDNGNLALSSDKRYTYDALDRLIAIESPTERFTFAYDSFHRRLFMSIEEWINNAWQLKDRLYYFYDGQNEIGAADANGKIVQLRVLGNTASAEIGSAIALELNGRVFAPISDLLGNITTIVDLEGRIPESYLFDAFGNHTSTSPPINPWRFSSKRHDESGLIYYGRRYFDPQYGRWITPDPIGFRGGVNLYAFVKNNPLTHVDLYGLIHVPLPVTTPSINAAAMQIPSFSPAAVQIPSVDPAPISTKQIAVNPLPKAPKLITKPPLCGVTNALARFTVDNLHYLQTSAFYIGSAQSDFLSQELFSMLASIENSQNKQIASLDNWATRLFSVDPSDPIYQSFYSNTLFGLEMASLASGGYGAARGAMAFKKLAKMPDRFPRFLTK